MEAKIHQAFHGLADRPVAGLLAEVTAQADFAQDQKKKGGPQAQKWINGIAEIAADAIRNSSITDDKGRELDRVKDKAVAHVTSILGGIKLPKIEGGN